MKMHRPSPNSSNYQSNPGAELGFYERVCLLHVGGRVSDSAADDPSVSQSVFTITEEAFTSALSSLKVPTNAFTFKTLC